MADLERLVLVASLAVQVDCKPMWRDGSTPTVYASSGSTLARRIKADPDSVVSACSVASHTGEEGPAAYRYRWDICLKAGAARRTLYTVWLAESEADVDRLLAERRAANELRRSLPHEARKKRPWGVL